MGSANFDLYKSRKPIVLEELLSLIGEGSD